MRSKNYINKPRNNLICLLTLLVMLLIAHESAVASIEPDPILGMCTSKASKITSGDSSPLKFSSTNNLQQATGSFEKNTGISVIGRVFDINCVPVKDAKIELWYKDNVSKVLEGNEKAHISMKGGKAVTDNLGRFGFLTDINDQSNHTGISIKILHPDFALYTGKGYFYEQNTNSKVAAIIEKLHDSRIRIYPQTDGSYYMEIILNQSNKTARY